MLGVVYICNERSSIHKWDMHTHTHGNQQHSFLLCCCCPIIFYYYYHYYFGYIYFNSNWRQKIYKKKNEIGIVCLCGVIVVSCDPLFLCLFFFVFVFNDDDDDFHYIRVHAWHILKTLLTTYEYTTTYTHTHTHITNKPTSNFFFVRTNLLFPFGVDRIFFLNVFFCMYVCVFAECTIVLNGWLVCWFFFG